MLRRERKRRLPVPEKNKEHVKGGETSKRVLFELGAGGEKEDSKEKKEEKSGETQVGATEKQVEAATVAGTDVNSAMLDMHVDQNSDPSEKEKEVPKEGGKRRGTYKKVERTTRASHVEETDKRNGGKRGADDT